MSSLAEKFSSNSVEDMESCIQNLIEQEQEHVIQYLTSQSENSRTLLKQLHGININAARRHLEQAQKPKEIVNESSILPVTTINLTTLPQQDYDNFKAIGEKEIAVGQIAAVILSGGQGTRLGFNGPKGMFPLPLPSNKSIFQMHIERIAKIKELCSHHNNQLTLPRVPIYIMTSDLNHTTIQQYFRENNYFGYPSSEIYFFEQGLLPCFDMSGKVIVESPTSLALAPDGNGGIYEALRTTGAFADMQKRGVKYLHVYGIDNILTKSLDPIFIGACVSQNIECGNKVVRRAHKAEKVGLTVNISGRMHILEYSELSPSIADSETSDGTLVYTAANICNHFLSVEFLQNKVFPKLSSSYHIALKKIPYYDPTTMKLITPAINNGRKLEMFIFDVFPFASKWLVCEVRREDEFAPIKNANSPTSQQVTADSPHDAVMLLSNQAMRWLSQAGAIVNSVDNRGSILSTVCEISPLVSYAGEGLGSYKGLAINLPFSATPHNYEA